MAPSLFAEPYCWGHRRVSLGHLSGSIGYLSARFCCFYGNYCPLPISRDLVLPQDGENLCGRHLNADCRSRIVRETTLENELERNTKRFAVSRVVSKCPRCKASD